MALRKPTSYVAARDITLNGTSYAKGATIPGATILTFKHLSALLSSNRIKPVPDPHSRRGRWRPWPTHVPLKVWVSQTLLSAEPFDLGPDDPPPAPPRSQPGAGGSSAKPKAPVKTGKGKADGS
jgi:hypothetical protein